MPRPLIGIDPGKTGALAVVQGDRVEWIETPRAGKDIDWAEAARWLEHVVEGDVRDARATVEKVHALPKQGVSSTFQFGAAFGGCLGLLGALRVGYELVTPQRWKKAMLPDTKREKADAIARVRRMYPELSLRRTERCRKDHDGAAEAILLALYGQRG